MPYTGGMTDSTDLIKDQRPQAICNTEAPWQPVLDQPPRSGIAVGEGEWADLRNHWFHIESET